MEGGVLLSSPKPSSHSPLFSLSRAQTYLVPKSTVPIHREMHAVETTAIHAFCEWFSLLDRNKKKINK